MNADYKTLLYNAIVLIEELSGENVDYLKEEIGITEEQLKDIGYYN